MAEKKSTFIEDLLHWAWHTEKAEMLYERGATLHDTEREADGHTVYRRSADGTGAVEVNALLGTRVDTSGPACVPIAEDAERVYKAVMAMPADQRNLLTDFARHQLPPAWQGAFRIEVAYRVNRKQKQVEIGYLDTVRAKYPHAIIVDVLPNNTHISHVKNRYGEWMLALIELTARLAGKLERWNVIGLRSVSEPWLDAEKKFNEDKISALQVCPKMLT